MDSNHERVGQLSKEKYTERVNVIKYSITFAGAAVAFLVTAKTKLNFDIPQNTLKLMLAFWGSAIFTGFLVYILSYREVWYHQRLNEGFRKSLIPRVELSLLYFVLFAHPVLMIVSIAYTVVALWKAVD